MLSPLHPDLIAVLDLAEVLSPTRYRLRGETRDVATAGVAPEEVPAALVTALRDELYRRLYIRAPDPVSRPPTDGPNRAGFLAALSSANAGRGTWEHGWTVHRLEDDGRVVVVRDGLLFWADPSNLRAVGGWLVPGAPCQARVGKEVRHLVPGFYLALGDADGDFAPGRTADVLVRLYWNLSAEAAAPFLASATGLLNAAGLPFQIKVLRDPAAYLRADAGVVYLRRRDFPQAAYILSCVHISISPGLKVDVPFFTKQLADGLGVAEDPTDGSSFGEHRCRLVAEALWCSFTSGMTDRGARVELLAETFRRAGLDPRRPYLQPRSTDDYSLPVVHAPHSSLAVATASSPESPLDSAARIGRALCRQAVWDREGACCNWVGGRIDDQAGAPALQALGYDLYGGSAGIALFLAELYSLTSDPEFQRTALGAVARSIRQIERRPDPQASPFGFFSGDLGVAYAACRAGELLELDGAGDRVTSVLDRVARAAAAAAPGVEMDVIGGHAGAIPALLVLSRNDAFRGCREVALVLGEALVRVADRQGPAFAWPPAARGAPEESRFLTGLAHGASGFGLALMELHAATGRADFLEAARGAFAYEDALFDPGHGNWPDLRPSGLSGSGADPGAPRFAVAWCHGAGGIALARLRAAALDPDRGAAHAATARIALATSLAALDRRLEESQGDVCLCHGLSGLAEVVGIAGELSNNAAYRDRAAEVLSVLVLRHSVKADWPTGLVRGGPNPSLMLGTAGIGHALLRRHDPARVPPVLILLPERGKSAPSPG
jgi:hypothetical protein